jgi:hypothetical protein
MFKQEFSKCSVCDCGGERLIVNRTKWLCEEKNRLRLDKSKPSKKRSALRNHTKDRSKIEIEYSKIQREILEEQSTCNNCNCSDNLSFSHLVPRSRRRDLIAERKNIVLHCIGSGDKEGCHSRWERGDDTMSDYESNMQKVKELDSQYYELLRMKRGE